MAFRRLQAGAKDSELDSLINASGKMVLLFKLLPKLRNEGKKVMYAILSCNARTTILWACPSPGVFNMLLICMQPDNNADLKSDWVFKMMT